MGCLGNELVNIRLVLWEKEVRDTNINNNNKN